jgi:hypothetical protein
MLIGFGVASDARANPLNGRKHARLVLMRRLEMAGRRGIREVLGALMSYAKSGNGAVPGSRGDSAFPSCMSKRKKHGKPLKNNDFPYKLSR